MEHDDYPPVEPPDLDRLDWSNANHVDRAEHHYGRREVRVAWARAYLADPRSVPVADFVDVPPRDDPRRGRSPYGMVKSEEDYVLERVQNILRRESQRLSSAERKRSVHSARSEAWRVRKEAEEIARVAAKHDLDPSVLTYANARRVVMGQPLEEYVELDDELAEEFRDRVDDPNA